MKKKFQLFISGTVFILILIGFSGYGFLVQKLLGNGIRDQVILDNKVIGKEILNYLNKQVSHMDEASMVDAIQKLCDEVQLPNQGFICALQNDGNLLAAPGLKKGETMNLGLSGMTDYYSKKEHGLSFLQTDSVFLGKAMVHNGRETHIIASLPVENHNFRLNVHQDEAAILVMAKKLVRPLLYLGGGIALLIAVVGFFIADRIIVNYESRIEKQNQLIFKKNNEILASIRYARLLQRAILPSRTRLKNRLPDSFIFQMPKDIVSGDFFWVDKHQGKVYFSVIDCTGHGVPGALLSMVGYDLLEQAIHEQELSHPGDILDFMNQRIYHTFGHDDNRQNFTDGMDMAICIFSPSNMRLEFAGARNPALIVRGEGLIHLKGDRVSVGTPVPDKEKVFGNQEIDVKSKDRIYLFSDGFMDQFGAVSGKKFMMGRFKKLLLENRQVKVEEQEQILKKTFLEWKGTLEQIDDVMVLGIQI